MLPKVRLTGEKNPARKKGECVRSVHKLCLQGGKIKRGGEKTMVESLFRLREWEATAGGRRKGKVGVVIL